MKIMYSPQLSEMEMSYNFSGEIITATIGDVSDVFDFSSFPDGWLNVEGIETTLPVQPIVAAKRENGTLWITLWYPINSGATDEEKFPVWRDV